MREECKNYQSRTYASGEVARICTLDLAPEAPRTFARLVQGRLPLLRVGWGVIRPGSVAPAR